MKSKKSPAPRRAGNAKRWTRSEQELDVAQKLELLQRESPAAFNRCMRLLAKLIGGSDAETTNVD